MIRQAREEIRKEFARRLQAAMNDKGWSQSDLARAAFGSGPGGTAKGRDNISVYMRAQSLPLPKHLHKIAKALGKKPEDLLPQTGLNDLHRHEPSWSIEDVGGGRSRLTVKQEVSTETALKIATMLRNETSSDKK